MVALRIAVALLGATVVVATVASAVRTVVIPRAVPVQLTRFVFLTMRRVFRLRAGPSKPYEQRDEIMALYAPVSLLTLLLTWLVLVLAGYTAIYWALGRPVLDAFVLSGSSALTLGFEAPRTLPQTILVFTQAGIGLLLLALLITYMPSIYQVFSRREALVAGLEVRAGSPPTGVEMLQRSWRVDHLQGLHEVWERWEDWFLDVQETHTSFPAVVFFRSPLPDHSWVTASGAVLDGASLLLAAVDRPADPRAAYCIRAGYLALRRVAAFFRIPFDPDPAPDDPISIARVEFDEACAALRQQGLPLKHDVEQAWRDFRGWRVNYDRVLVSLAGLTMAPMTPWSSDRSLRDWRPRAIFGRERSRR